MRRFIGVVVVLLVLFWVISAPLSASATVNAVLATLASFANSIILFLHNLFV